MYCSKYIATIRKLILLPSSGVKGDRKYILLGSSVAGADPKWGCRAAADLPPPPKKSKFKKTQFL